MASRDRMEHVVNAPVLSFSTVSQVEQLRREEQWSSADRNAVTLVKTPELCVVLIALHKGARMEQHRIDGPLTLHVLDGALRLSVQRTTHDLAAHSLLSLDSDIIHDIVAIEDCAFLLTIFYPPSVAITHTPARTHAPSYTPSSAGL